MFANAITKVDSLSYGITDYMPIAYTDIDKTTGLQNPKQTGVALNADTAGAQGFRRKIGDITDGLSNTIFVIEDAARLTQTSGSYNVQTQTYGGAPGADSTQLFAATNVVPGTFGGFVSVKSLGGS